MTDTRRSRRHGRRARHPHALGDAEAPASAARPAHGRLGHRGRARRRRASRSSSSRRRRRVTASTGSRSRCRSEPLGTGDAVRAARDEARARRTGTCSCSPATRRCSRRTSLRELVETHRRERAAATVLSFEPPDPRAYGRARPRRRRPARAHRRGVPTRRRTSSSSARSTPRSTSSRPRSCGPRSSGCEPQNAQGELYLTDAIGFLVAATASRSRSTSPPIRREAEGVNTRVELAAAAAALRDRINEAHMLAGVTIVDPQSTWIDAGVEIEPDVTIHPFTVIRGRRQDRVRRRDRPVRVRPPGHEVGREREDRHLRGGEEVHGRRADEDPAPLLHRRRRDRRGYEHRRRQHHCELQARAGAAEGDDAHREQRQDRSRQYVRCSRRDRRRRCGLRPARSSPKMFRPARWRGSRRGRRRKKGWVYDKHGNRDD